MKKTGSLGFGILTFFGIVTVFFSPGACQTITEPIMYVGGNGIGNFTSIQDALDNVTAGGTVYVFPGVYHERIMITKPVHLIGEDKTTTIIDGDYEEYVVILTAGNSTLSGFTIIHSGSVFPKAGVYVTSNNNKISGNILTNNFYGMRLESAQHNTISGNEITHNNKCGVYFSRSSHNILIANIVKFHLYNGFGLFEFSNNNTFLENILSQNNYSGITIRDSLNNHVVDNHLFENHIGLYVPPPEYNTVVQRNVISGNSIDLLEEQNSIIMIGSGFGVFIIIVFFLLKKWKT